MSNFKAGDKLRVVSRLDNCAPRIEVGTIVTFEHVRSDWPSDIYIKEHKASWRADHFVLHEAAPLKVRTLKGDNKAVFEALVDGAMRSVETIKLFMRPNASDSTVTARIRDLRKPIYGGFNIEHIQQGKHHFYRLVK